MQSNIADHLPRPQKYRICQSGLAAVGNTLKALITRGKYGFSIVTENSAGIVIESSDDFSQDYL